MPASGITFGNPELEMRLAAQWGHYTFERFVKLSGDDQAATIAAFRVTNHSETLLSYRASLKASSKKPRG